MYSELSVSVAEPLIQLESRFFVCSGEIVETFRRQDRVVVQLELRTGFTKRHHESFGEVLNLIA